MEWGVAISRTVEGEEGEEPPKVYGEGGREGGRARVFPSFSTDARMPFHPPPPPPLYLFPPGQEKSGYLQVVRFQKFRLEKRGREGGRREGRSEGACWIAHLAPWDRYLHEEGPG
jgi:hypothetical protein